MYIFTFCLKYVQLLLILQLQSQFLCAAFGIINDEWMNNVTILTLQSPIFIHLTLTGCCAIRTQTLLQLTVVWWCSCVPSSCREHKLSAVLVVWDDSKTCPHVTLTTYCTSSWTKQFTKTLNALTKIFMMISQTIQELSRWQTHRHIY